MKKRTVVIRKKTSNWQSNIKRKIETKKTINKKLNAGFISPVFVVFALIAFSGLFYLYSINKTATKGIEMKDLEKEIVTKRNENEYLKIKEAELKSLYKIEESSREMKMIESSDINYVEENQSIAYGKIKN